jgi:hypothetical protein
MVQIIRAELLKFGAAADERCMACEDGEGSGMQTRSPDIPDITDAGNY